MKRNTHGFTIVEILVVVAVIGILTTIGVLTYSKVQSDSRDSQRSASTTVISEALEKYYDQNGEYPSCSSMIQDAAIVTSNVLKGTDPAVLEAPGSTPANNNSIKCSDITGSDGSDVYAYVGESSSTCQTGSSCLEWTLQYKEESTGTIKTIHSRHTVALATSGTEVLSVAVVNASQMTASWTPIANTIRYELQRSTSSSFSSPTVTSLAATSTSVTGLTPNVTYYFRVRPIASTETGDWSNVITKFTDVDTPTLSGSTASTTQINMSWTASMSGVTYELQRATNSSFSGPTTTSHAGTSTSVTGLTPNVTYYFRVRTIVASVSYTGPWSNVDTEVIAVNTPTLSGSVASTTQLNTSWTASMSGVTYELQRSAASTFSSPTTTPYGTTSAAVTGLVPGNTYYFHVRAVVAAASYVGSWSNTLTLTTPINPPSGTLAMNATLPSSTVARGATGGVSCASGTSLQYSIRYNSTNTSAAGGWSSWTITTVRDQTGAYQGNKYTFQAQARCVGGDISSSYVTSGTDYVVPPMTTPSAPTYLSPGSFKDETYAIVNYASYCPAGTWMVNGTFHTVYMLTGAGFGPHPFGYNDWWNLGETYGSGGLQYWGHYQCTTYYVASPYSPESYNVIYVYQ